MSIVLVEPNGRGSHIGYEKNLHKTLEKAIEYGMYSFQFFLGSPQSFQRSKIEKDDIKKTKKLLEHFPTNMFTHFPYVFNLAGSIKNKTCGYEETPSIRTCVNSISYELKVIGEAGGVGCVLHPGCWTNKEDGIKAIAESINLIEFHPESACLILENTAGEKNKIGKTLTDLYEIWELCENKEKVGICIDTCHIFASGEYDLRMFEEIDRLYSDFVEVFGDIKILKLIHLNDSETKQCSCADRHMTIYDGEIWNPETQNLNYFLNTFQGIPTVLETVSTDYLKICDL